MPRRFASLALLALAFAAVTAAALAATPFRGHTSTYTGVGWAGQLTIDAAGARRGGIRAHVVLPGSWRRRGSLDARTLRFDTGNSCRHRVTLTPRLVQAPAATAAERAAALVPGTRSLATAEGTRETAAFRVARVPGAKTVVGVLVQPLAVRYSSGAPAGTRIYAEITATATADPSRDCHAGGPRRVAEALGDAFAAGSVGGFALAR